MYTKHVWYASRADMQSADTIHQILMFGTLEDIQSLKRTAGEAVVKELFLRFPKKIYTAPALNFIKKFILRLTSSIDEQKYLKYTPRSVR